MSVQYRPGLKPHKPPRPPASSAALTTTMRVWPSNEYCRVCGDQLWTDGTSIFQCFECSKREREEQFVNHVLSMNTNRLHRDATFETFTTQLDYQKRGKNAAQAFASEIQPNVSLAIVFWSNGYGTGKTHLASAIANAVSRNGWNVKCISMPTFMAEIRSTYRSTSASDEYSLLRSATVVDLLVIDELGLEHVNNKSWYQEKMYQMINARYLRGPMVITTNLTPTDMPARIGGASFSRLWEMTAGGQWFVDMNGQDYRMK